MRLKFLLLCGLLGCAQPLQHVRTLSTQHQTAVKTCVAAAADTCPCAVHLRLAMEAWRKVSVAVAAGDEATAIVAETDAHLAEAEARTRCKGTP